MRLDGQAAAPQERAGKTAAQRSERRCREISDRRMPAGREMLEVLQDAGIEPKTPDDLRATSACAVTCHSDRSRPSVGDEMLKSARKPGSHHRLRRQQRKYGKEDDAA